MSRLRPRGDAPSERTRWTEPHQNWCWSDTYPGEFEARGRSVRLSPRLVNGYVISSRGDSHRSAKSRANSDRVSDTGIASADRTGLYGTAPQRDHARSGATATVPGRKTVRRRGRLE